MSDGRMSDGRMVYVRVDGRPQMARVLAHNREGWTVEVNPGGARRIVVVSDDDIRGETS